MAAFSVVKWIFILDNLKHLSAHPPPLEWRRSLTVCFHYSVAVDSSRPQPNHWATCLQQFLSHPIYQDGNNSMFQWEKSELRHSFRRMPALSRGTLWQCWQQSSWDMRRATRLSLCCNHSWETAHSGVLFLAVCVRQACSGWGVQITLSCHLHCRGFHSWSAAEGKAGP